MRALLALALGFLPLLLPGCRGTPREDAWHSGPWSFEELFGRNWRLVQLEGRGVQSLQRPELRILDSGAIEGDTGVNRFFGIWTRDGEAGLSLQGLGSTRRAGPPELLEQETRFLSALGAIDSWLVVGEMLQFRRGDQVLCAFVQTR
jgi:heat shock protein HslJ